MATSAQRKNKNTHKHTHKIDMPFLGMGVRVRETWSAISIYNRYKWTNQIEKNAYRHEGLAIYRFEHTHTHSTSWKWSRITYIRWIFGWHCDWIFPNTSKERINTLFFVVAVFFSHGNNQESTSKCDWIEKPSSLWNRSTFLFRFIHLTKGINRINTSSLLYFRKNLSLLCMTKSTLFHIFRFLFLCPGWFEAYMALTEGITAIRWHCTT